MALFFAGYMVWFIALERWRRPYHIIASPLDALIPFNELFILPYFAWFFFVPGVCIYLLIKAPEEFDRAAVFVGMGMVLCLLVYTVYPNAQMLRPREFPRRNVLIDLVEMTYRVDTSTNVCPSIHTLNTLAVQLAIGRSEAFRGRVGLKIATWVLSISIVAATVSLKQHSILDVLWAVALIALLYTLIYKLDVVGRIKRRAEGLLAA